MHYNPGRRNVTTSVVGLGNNQICKNLTQNSEPQRSSWQTQKRKKMHFRYSGDVHFCVDSYNWCCSVQFPHIKHTLFLPTDPQKCENDILKESVIAGEHQSPYRPNHDLRAVAFHNVSTPFIITRLHQPPTVTIAADRRSFLKAIFPAAIVKVDSLTGRMSQNSTHWTVEVMGSVQQCPGNNNNSNNNNNIIIMSIFLESLSM